MSGLSLPEGDFWNLFGTSAAVGADQSYSTPRSTATVPTDAVGSMEPVTAANDAGGWSDFWKGTLQTVVGYSIAKDAVRSGVMPTRAADGQPIYTGSPAMPVQGGGLQMGHLMFGALIVGGLVLLNRTAK